MRRLMGIAGLALVLLAVALTTAHAEPFWHQDEFSGGFPQNNWCALSAASDSIAWATSENGAWVARRDSFVFGGYWRQIDLGDYDNWGGIESQYDLVDIFVLPSNPSYVWIAGYGPSPKKKGVVLYSTNARASDPVWSAKYPLENDEDFEFTPFYAVHFSNQSRGYLTAGNGVVLVDWGRVKEWR